MRRTELLFSFITLVIDIFILFGIFISAYYFRYSFAYTSLPYGNKIELTHYFTLLFLLVPVWIAIFFFSGVYRQDGARKILAEITSIFWAVTFSVVITTTVMFVLRNVDFSRLMLIYIWVLAFIALSLFRVVLIYVRRTLYRRGIGVKRVLIIGKNKATQAMNQFLDKYPQYGYLVVRRVNLYEGLKIKRIAKILDDYKVNQVILGGGFSDKRKDIRLMGLAQQRRIIFSQIPNIYEFRKGTYKFETIGDVPLLRYRVTPLDGWGRIIKRFLDFLFSMVLLIILSPIFLLIAILIKTTSRGPVFYSHKRVGRDGKIFYLHKFRSMYKDAETKSKRTWTIKNDPRITPFGGVIRKTNLDEIPQFWNIFVGDMSFVGPRPEQPQFVAKFEKEIPDYMKRLRVKSGLTGWAAVNGLKGDTSIRDRVEYDIYYIDNWSLWFDIKICVKTVYILIYEILGGKYEYRHNS